MSSKTFRFTVALAVSAAFLLAGQTPVAATGDGCSTGFASGAGTSGDPYMITTVQEFKEIEDCSASYTYFEVANDIDFGGNQPGTGIPRLNGELDGAGFTLKDVFVDTGTSEGPSVDDEFGIVGYLNGDGTTNSIITNIIFDNPKIIPKNSSGYSAGLIGFAGSGASLSDITVTGAQIGDSNNQTSRSGILVGSVESWPDGNHVRNINVEGEIHCATQCGGFSGFFSLATNATVELSDIYSNVEMKASSSNTEFGGLFGSFEFGASTSSLTDVSVSIAGTGSAKNVGGVAGRASLRNSGTSTHIFDRVSISGSLPSATNQGGLVGDYEAFSNLTIGYFETVIGASFDTGSTNSRLIAGNASTGVDKITQSLTGDTEIYHSTSFSTMSEYLPGTGHSGGLFIKVDSADRSDPATYSSNFSITDNLSNSANWYVQAADTRSELFGGYPVPYSLANSAAFGPRYFFKPNGGTGTAVGRVGPLPTALIDPIANPFTRTGFEFDSWNNSATDPGQTLTQSGGITGLDGVSIYARWNELYDTTFDANTADSGSVSSIVDDNSITVPGKGNLVKNGFEFAGWNTLANGNGTPYAEGETLNLTTDTTLFAQWQAPQSNPAPYSGPVITSVGTGSSINALSPETIRVSGERLGSVSGVSVDGKPGEVISVATDHFMMKLPLGLEPGTYDLVVQSSIGNLTYLDAITIVGSNAAVDSEEIQSSSYGEVSAWTKRISYSQVKVYVKFPTVGEKVRISHQTGGNGSYESVYVKTTSSESMEGLRVVEGVGTYIVRTIDLSDINRIRVTVGDSVEVQVRYNN